MALVARTIQGASYPSDERLLHVDADVALGCDGNVFFIIWRDKTTVEGVRILESTFGAWSSTHPRDVAVVTIIEPKAQMPSPGSREALAVFLSKMSKVVVVSGVAFEGDGFIAASIRGVVVGLTLLARQTYPHRVFKNVAEVAQWIELESGRTGKAFSSLAIQSSASRLRAQVPRRH